MNRRRLPVSLRACLELVRLRVQLPRMLETEPLDVLIERLASWRPAHKEPKGRCERPFTQRAQLDASIRATEAVISRLRLAPDTCLYRSMGRYALLRGYGVDALFFMGVRGGAEAGHAWVEDGEGPYGEEIEDGEYVVTFSHPRPREELSGSDAATREGGAPR